MCRNIITLFWNIIFLRLYIYIYIYVYISTFYVTFSLFKPFLISIIFNVGFESYIVKDPKECVK